jgi:bacteriophage N4 adsorption protein B
VGCAFSRRAIELIASLSHNELFNIDSLTEDYDIGIRLQPYGLKQIFVRQAIERITYKKSLFRRKLRKVKIREYIAIRENFPSSFRAAKRQKSRWIVGICLQAWASLGWPGPWSTKYMLYRDRKGLVNNAITLLGYYVLGVIGLYWLSVWLLPGAYNYPAVVTPGSLIWYIIWVDTALMSARLCTRCYCIYRFYNLRQALLSFPRFFWGNVINFFAVSRAMYLYVKYLLTGKLIAWDKTSHVYPSDNELKALRRKIGDLLLDRRLITVAQLDEALLRQKQDPQPLGTILADMGLVTEEDLINVLGAQLFLPVRNVDPYEVPLELLAKVPQEDAYQSRIFPVETNRAGRLLLATTVTMGQEELKQLEERLGCPLDVCLTTRKNLAFAIGKGYQRLTAPEQKSGETWQMGREFQAGPHPA